MRAVRRRRRPCHRRRRGRRRRLSTAGPLINGPINSYPDKGNGGVTFGWSVDPAPVTYAVHGTSGWGNGTGTPQGDHLPPVTVQLTDASDGNPVANTEVVFQIQAGNDGGNGTFPTLLPHYAGVRTNAQGYATAPPILAAHAGTFTLTVYGPNTGPNQAMASVTFTVTG